MVKRDQSSINLSFDYHEYSWFVGGEGYEAKDVEDLWRCEWVHLVLPVKNIYQPDNVGDANQFQTDLGPMITPGWWFGCHQFYFPIHIGFLIIQHFLFSH